VTDAFRLAVVPGVTVDRWAQLWSQRRPDVELRLVPVPVGHAELAGAEVDAGIVRLPVDQDTLHAIPLYTEATVVVVPREHLLTAADELTLADLADEILLRPDDDVLGWPDAGPPADAHRPATTAAAVELVAAEVGVLVTPMSLARLYHRRDLTYRPVTDAPVSSVALAWRRDGHTELVEEMIGIVRGRTANSTRGQAPAAPARRSGDGSGRAAPASGRGGASRSGTPRRPAPRRRGR
jgi:DNA-binding transcriptional LysR family regulator